MPLMIDRRLRPARCCDVRGLQKFFPIPRGFCSATVGHVRAVDDVNFDLHEGETLGLVGESGCGKTTTSRCILRAIDPTGGQILYRARRRQRGRPRAMPRTELRPLRREMQMIFQDPFALAQSAHDAAGQSSASRCWSTACATARERTDRVAELLRLVGLRPEFMHRFPHAFSGGQRQRIGIARALATNPRLVVADEPVSALDVSVQAQVLNLLLELQARWGSRILFVAHDLWVVRHISDRVAVMYVGQMVELAPTGGGIQPSAASLHRGADARSAGARSARAPPDRHPGWRGAEPRTPSRRLLFPSALQFAEPAAGRGPRLARGGAGAFRPLPLRRADRSVATDLILRSLPSERLEGWMQTVAC